MSDFQWSNLYNFWTVLAQHCRLDHGIYRFSTRVCTSKQDGDANPKIVYWSAEFRFPKLSKCTKYPKLGLTPCLSSSLVQNHIITKCYCKVAKRLFEAALNFQIIPWKYKGTWLMVLLLYVEFVNFICMVDCTHQTCLPLCVEES